MSAIDDFDEVLRLLHWARSTDPDRTWLGSLWHERVAKLLDPHMTRLYSDYEEPKP